MNTANNHSKRLRLPSMQGILPIEGSRIPTELIAGLTLAALAVPEVMGYAKIAGMLGLQGGGHTAFAFRDFEG